MSKTVLLAMSGGTDSSVTAMLLQEQGYLVKGITFITHHLPDGSEHQFAIEARSLATRLNIQHITLDISKRFQSEIIDYFTHEYANGRTPNPCIKCNETIKWAILHDLSIEHQCDYIATGHYANITQYNNSYYISKGADKTKDQSYFLWRLPQHILNHALMPLGQFTKIQVKTMALERGFKSISTKKESMGICFLTNTDVNSFLKQNLPLPLQERGMVIDKDGAIIGAHNGAPFYTIGQKKGLTLIDEATGYCVHQILPSKGLIIAGKPEELFTSEIALHSYYLVDINDINPLETYHIRIRGVDSVPYHLANVEIKNHQLKVKFHQPAWAITPGQSLVIYDNERVLGGGVVE